MGHIYHLFFGFIICLLCQKKLFQVCKDNSGLTPQGGGEGRNILPLEFVKELLNIYALRRIRNLKLPCLALRREWGGNHVHTNKMAPTIAIQSMGFLQCS